MPLVDFLRKRTSTGTKKLTRRLCMRCCCAYPAASRADVRGPYPNQNPVALIRSRFGSFRAVFRPNMRPECLVLAIWTDRTTLWHPLGAPRWAKGAFRASLGVFWVSDIISCSGQFFLLTHVSTVIEPFFAQTCTQSAWFWAYEHIAPPFNIP